MLTRFRLPLQFDFHQKVWLLPAAEISRVRERIFPSNLAAMELPAARSLVANFKTKHKNRHV